MVLSATIYADGPEEIRKAVRENIAKGIDLVKIFAPQLQDDEMATIIELENISNLRKLKMVFKDGVPVNLTKDEGQTNFWELYFK